ncbi:MAG: hypothetical protein ACRERE_01730, partial [Candidatus Entotheonellia bacterium]
PNFSNRFGTYRGEGESARVQRLDFPHPSPLPRGEGVLSWRLWGRAVSGRARDHRRRARGVLGMMVAWKGS